MIENLLKKAMQRLLAEGGHTPDVMHRHYANLRIPAAHVTAFWRIGP